MFAASSGFTDEPLLPSCQTSAKHIACPMNSQSKCVVIIKCKKRRVKRITHSIQYGEDMYIA